MQTLGYYNGKIDLLEKMQVPMLDRGCYFGDGIYEASYCRNYKIFALDEHIQRFFDSAEKTQINLPISKSQLEDLLNDLIKKVDSHEQFVYWQATRDTGVRDHIFEQEKVANLWVMLKANSIKPKELTYRLKSYPDIRYKMCNVKTINLLPNVLALNDAKCWGCQEVVFHRNGRVTECGHSNICMLEKNCLICPPNDEFCLDGIALRHLKKACAVLGITVLERPFCLTQLMLSDEVIICSSGALCLRVSSIDNIKVGGKAPDIFSLLQDAVYDEFMTTNEA